MKEETSLLNTRLQNQFITSHPVLTPSAIVKKMVAMQAQDFNASKWAIALRSNRLTKTQIETSLNAGEILRIHILRPTWHYVSSEDIYWILSLTSQYVQNRNLPYYHKLGLDDNVFSKTETIIKNSLKGGKSIRRENLIELIKQKGISTTKLGYLYILMHAELNGIICNGVSEGNIVSYALLHERVPNIKNLPRDEALAQLTLGYFTSHGPTTIKDFIWWSGLPIKIAKEGFDMVKDQLDLQKYQDVDYWFCFPLLKDEINEAVYLLPNFDEYIVGYSNREIIFDRKQRVKLDGRKNVLFQHSIVLNGKIIGNWKVILKKNEVQIRINLFVHVTKAQLILLKDEINRFSNYNHLPVSYVIEK